MKIFTSLGILLAFFTGTTIAKACDCDSATTPYYGGIIQQTINGQSALVPISFFVKRLDTITIDSVDFVLPDSMVVDSHSLDTGIYTGADSSLFTFYLRHTQQQYPYYMQEINLYIYSSAGRQNITGYVLYTPWNTVDIYGLGKLPTDNRVWITDGITTPTRLTLHPDSLPDYPDTPDAIGYQHIEGLPYLVPFAQSSDTAGPNKVLRTFRGQLRGRLVFAYRNEENEDVEMPIANIRLEVKVQGKQVATSTTNHQGEFNILYTYSTPNVLLPTISGTLEIVSQDSELEDENGHPGGKLVVLKGTKKTFGPKIPHKHVYRSAIDFGQNHNSGNLVVHNYKVHKVQKAHMHHIYHWARRARDFFAENNMPLPKTWILVPEKFGSNPLSCFFTPEWSAQGRIDLRSPACIEQESILWHEFGHFAHKNLAEGGIHRESKFGFPGPVPSTAHYYKFNNPDVTDALIEGLADGISFIIDSRYYTDDQEASRGFWNQEYHRVTTDLVASTHPMSNERVFASALLDLWDDHQNLYQNSEIDQNIIRDDLYGEELCSLSFEDILRPFLDDDSHPIRDVSMYFKDLAWHASCEDRPQIRRVVDINLVNLNTNNFSQFVSTDFIEEQKDFTHLNDDVQATSLSNISIGQQRTYVHNYKNYNIDELNSTSRSFNVTSLGNGAYISDPLRITGNGHLYINANKPNGLPSNTTGHAAFGSHLNISGCGAPITVDNGGTLALGHAQHSSAKLTLQYGSVLNLDYENGTAANLVLESGSELILDASTTLKVGAAAHIELNEGSVLEISGAVELAPNAVLSFSGSGHIVFSSPQPANISFGAGSSIQLTGSGTSDVVAHILQNDLYALTNQNAPQGGSISISQGKVLLGHQSRLATNLPISLQHCVFEPLAIGYTPRGLYLYGQNGVDIRNCTFTRMRHGIKAELYFGGAGLSLSKNQFTNCEFGLSTWGKYAKVSDCDFTNCTYGWVAQTMTQPSVFELGSITQSSQHGINYSGGISELYVSNAHIKHNQQAGVAYQGQTLAVGCSEVENNRVGLSAYGKELVLSPVLRRGTGYNNLVENNYSITGYLSKLELENGQNDLEANQLWRSNRLDIQALMTPINPNLPLGVFCHNNRWSSYTATPATNSPRPPLQTDRNIWVKEEAPMPPLNDVPFTALSVINQRPDCPSSAFGGEGGGTEPSLSTQHAVGLRKNPEVPIQTLDFVATLGIAGHEFQGMNLEMAVHTTVDEMYFRDTLDTTWHETAANRFADIILATDYSENDGYVIYLTEYAYQRMLEAFGHVLVEAPVLAPALGVRVLNVQNAFITQLENETVLNTYQGEFALNMDVAFTHHSLDDRASALSQLSGMLVDFQGRELTIINQAICQIQFEKDVLDGIINFTDTELPGLYTCIDTIVWPKIPDTLANGRGETINHAMPIEHFPNPSKEVSYLKIVESTHGVGGYQIIDLTGKILRKGSFSLNETEIVEIPQIGLSPGCYVLEVNLAEKAERIKLVIE